MNHHRLRRGQARWLLPLLLLLAGAAASCQWFQNEFFFLDAAGPQVEDDAAPAATRARP